MSLLVSVKLFSPPYTQPFPRQFFPTSTQLIATQCSLSLLSGEGWGVRASLVLRKLAQGSRACNCCPIRDSFPIQSTGECVLEQKHHTTITNPQTSMAEGDVGSRTRSANLSGSCLPLLPILFTITQWASDPCCWKQGFLQGVNSLLGGACLKAGLPH